MDKLPENVRYWLEGYAREIKALGADVQASTKSRRSIGTPIAPLLTSQWDQNAPYNLQCPMDGASRSVTGCVATAMAQLMYYHKCGLAKFIHLYCRAVRAETGGIVYF
mgnify:CR=1 FL=1